MTQKELLYMEDAIEHETNLIEIATLSIENIEDKTLKTFMKGQLKKHQSLKDKLMKIMEDTANEW